MKDITFRRITGDGAATTLPPAGAGQPWPQLWLRMVWPCADANITRNASATPVFRNIVYEDVVLRRGGLQVTVQGLPESPIQNVSFRNVSFAESFGAPPPPPGTPRPPAPNHAPWVRGELWGPCEHVQGHCDHHTPAGSCPPCFTHEGRAPAHDPAIAASRAQHATSAAHRADRP